MSVGARLPPFTTIEHFQTHSRSKTVAKPCPTPDAERRDAARGAGASHLVDQRRSQAGALQPSGWSIAIAPPLTFNFALSMPSSRWQARACAAKKRLVLRNVGPHARKKPSTGVLTGTKLSYLL